MKVLLSIPTVITRSIAGFVKDIYEYAGRKLYVSVALLLMSNSVLANKGLQGVGEGVGKAASGLASGAVSVGGFVGVVMIIIAFVKGRGARQQGEGIGTYVGMAVLGAMLVSIPLIIGTLQTTLIEGETGKADYDKLIGGGSGT